MYRKLGGGDDLPCRTRTHLPYWTIRIGVKSRVADPVGVCPDPDPTYGSDYRDETGSGSNLIWKLDPDTTKFSKPDPNPTLFENWIRIRTSFEPRSGSDLNLKTGESGSATLAKRFTSGPTVRIFGRRMQIFLAGFTQPKEDRLYGAQVVLALRIKYE